MQTKFQLFLGAAAAVTALTASGCMQHHHHPHGPYGGAQSEGEGLTVLGVGEAKGAPDVAHTSIGIEVRADTAEAATAQANEHMTAILAAIKGAGVADTDLHTHDFSVSFERDFTPAPVAPPPQPKPIAGKGGTTQATVPAQSAVRGTYRVSNTVEVTVRDLTRASAVLTAATSAGANNVWGISFDVTNPEPLHEQAREQAIAHARHNAEQLAKLTGVKLGAIVTVDDQADLGQQPPRMFKALAQSADGSQVPVQGGELTVSHQVRLVYAIEKP